MTQSGLTSFTRLSTTNRILNEESYGQGIGLAALAVVLAAVPVFRGVCPAECQAELDPVALRLERLAGFPVHR